MGKLSYLKEKSRVFYVCSCSLWANEEATGLWLDRHVRILWWSINKSPFCAITSVMKVRDRSSIMLNCVQDKLENSTTLVYHQSAVKTVFSGVQQGCQRFTSWNWINKFATNIPYFIPRSLQLQLQSRVLIRPFNSFGIVYMCTYKVFTYLSRIYPFIIYTFRHCAFMITISLK